MNRPAPRNAVPGRSTAGGGRGSRGNSAVPPGVGRQPDCLLLAKAALAGKAVAVTRHRSGGGHLGPGPQSQSRFVSGRGESPPVGGDEARMGQAQAKKKAVGVRRMPFGHSLYSAER